MASRGHNDPYFIQYSLSDNTCQLPANQDYRRLPGRSHRMYQVHGTLGDVIEVKASWKTPQTMILSPVVRQLASPVLLTLRKMSLKSSQASKMSLNTSPTSKIQKYQKFKNFPHVGGSSLAHEQV